MGNFSQTHALGIPMTHHCMYVLGKQHNQFGKKSTAEKNISQKGKPCCLNKCCLLYSPKRFDLSWDELAVWYIPDFVWYLQTSHVPYDPCICMVYLPTCTIKNNHSWRSIHHTWILWVSKLVLPKKNPWVSRHPPFRPGSLHSFRFILVGLVTKNVVRNPKRSHSLRAGVDLKKGLVETRSLLLQNQGSKQPF